MKKYFALAAVVAATMTLTSCGTGASAIGSGNTTTSSSTSNALGTVLNGVTSQTGQSVLSSLLSSVLGGTTTQSSLVGTWTYSQPSVKFESENVLSQLGGSVISSKLETAMGTQLTKIGMKQGVSSITFDNSGNFKMALGSKSYNGTYTYNSSTKIMTLKGAFGLTTLNATVTVSAGTLYMLFDADKVFSIVSKVGSANSTLKSLLSNYNGIKLGWQMTK